MKCWGAFWAPETGKVPAMDSLFEIAAYHPMLTLLLIIAAVLALKAFGVNQEFQRAVVFRGRPGCCPRDPGCVNRMPDL